MKILPGRGLDFLDPWGNRIQVVQYDEIPFTKAEVEPVDVPAFAYGVRWTIPS